ncbi:BPTD_3080 family restriction endonuclease [Egbenema bharatensis]|uniref:BPTD_3080 family restriction endonuclease n=1 Tax=Egbenema bharatensis TaxID=3463334 RepID=UPI003A842E5C
MTYEVDTPILNSPFAQPDRYWFLREGEEPQLRDGRRPAIVYPPREGEITWDLSDQVLALSKEFDPGYEMVLVNYIRQRVQEWRSQDYPGVTRTTHELLHYWQREGRERRLFYAQLEAVETIIFLKEARADFLQGISIPTDEPTEQQQSEGIKAFTRYACKMATGSGKTTVMGMLCAWSILNKVNDRSDARFSDVVLIVCPNVTIRDRLGELDPERGEASLYRTRDLVPAELMDRLRQGRILTTNWHVFEKRSPQTSGDAPAKVSRVGVPLYTTETIRIAAKNDTARGKRYLTEETLNLQIAQGMLAVVEEKRDKQGNLESVKVESVRYVESDTAWIHRILGREVGGKQNILILNDEAHHAYRIRPAENDEADDEDEVSEYEQQEATIWVEGLDRIHQHRGINFCVDLSATPYYLSRVGKDANKPFPWVVSDFSLMDAIEAGLVKIPQLAVRDTTGHEIPGYFNIWKWVMDKLTPAERGGKKSNPKPDAILKYAQHPIAMLGGLWEENRLEWEQDPDREDPRPPVFILVCKNTAIAKVIYEWLAEGKQASHISPCKIEGFRNQDEQINTIRVDSKVVQEMESGASKSDESRWMRYTLDTVGSWAWTCDKQGNPIYPDGFEALALKLGRPLHPPGRDVRCIVSVGMLTEGWDCNTVTHIIGLRPFMSQLLCEQVVGRGLRRASYDLNEETGLMSEEVAKIFGVPFDIIPYKANPNTASPKKEKRHRIYAVPGKAQYKIEIPRVEGYTQSIRNRVAVDWEAIAPLKLDPFKIAPEVQMKATLPNNQGRPSLSGPGKLESVDLNPYRKGRRFQELVFDLAGGLTKSYVESGSYQAPAHVLFPQLRHICDRYLSEKVVPVKPAELIDVFLSPYYGWVIEQLVHAIRPNTEQGEAPEVPRYESHRGHCSTEDVNFWTSKPVREVVHSHVNAVVADTWQWEQAAAYIIDTHPATAAFVKNAGLGFAIPYVHNGQPHDYLPDFIIRLKTEQPCYFILETKGYDPLRDVKRDAAERWVSAVNADGRYGHWQYAMCGLKDVRQLMDEAIERF